MEDQLENNILSVRRFRPRIRDHITGKFNKKFASASITFTHNKLGQLHCNEHRWIDSVNDTKNAYHLIGGKVESTDRDILFTAIREFVEETNLFMDNNLVRNGKDKDYDILLLYLHLDIKPNVKYYDIKVSEYTELYHRCFVFNINKFSDVVIRNKVMDLPKFYSKLLNPDIRKIKELNYLKWINDSDKISKSDDFSPLLQSYYENINNLIKDKNS